MPENPPRPPHGMFDARYREAAAKSSELPPPSQAALVHSEALCRLIQDAIDSAGGKLSFETFMSMALYEPGLGYYSGGSQKFGEGGDFVTAPEMSPLFSRCIGRALAPLMADSDMSCITEFGAGSGALSAGVLQELETLGCLPEIYQILELSADLRARQEQTLQQRCPHLLENVRWLETMPEQLSGVVLANELLDAMPVRQFVVHNGTVKELCVTVGENGFGFVTDTADERILRRVEELSELGLSFDNGYTSEMGFIAEDWLATVGERLQRGVVLLIDYGFPAREFYHAQRAQGTLMCHYRHRAHPDPLILVGLQDITSHVDFSAMASAGVEAGLELYGFTNQASFLLGSGLTQLVAEVNPVDTRAQMEVAAQIKKLTLPHEMGELFKVIAFRRGIAEEIPGFQLRNMKHVL